MRDRVLHYYLPASTFNLSVAGQQTAKPPLTLWERCFKFEARFRIWYILAPHVWALFSPSLAILFLHSAFYIVWLVTEFNRACNLSVSQNFNMKLWLG